MSVIRKLFHKLAAVLFHPGFHTLGFCNVCDRPTIFICDLVADRWIRKCCWCRSTPKYRAIVSVIESDVGEKLARYVESKKIYELSTTSPIFRRLRGHANYEASGYFGDKPFGTKVTGHYWNQDLQHLTFPTHSFDTVISSETMEHVRLPWQGFAEVWRVLKPGGSYIFTIPYRDERKTLSRVDTKGDQDVFLLDKTYHLDPYDPQGSLVYTEFGKDLPDLLTPLGFDTELVRVHDIRADIQDDLRPVSVFLARKRSAIQPRIELKAQAL